MYQPGYVKNNPATRAADALAEANARLGAPAGRGYGVGQTRVESATMAAPPPVALDMPPEEVARLNRLAMEHGVPAEALGEAPDQRMPEEVMSTRQPTGGAYMPPSMPRLPDFSKIEGIDTRNGCVVVDGLRFPVPADDLRDLQLYIMTVVKEAVDAQFKQAFDQVTAGGPSDTIEIVPEVPVGDTEGPEGELPSVREQEESSVETRESGEGEGAAPEIPQA